MSTICFFTEKTTFQIPYPNLLRTWIKDCIQHSGKVLMHLNYIFCRDGYLYKLNKTHLSHSTFTDVITFNYADKLAEIEGDAYISIERVQENAHRLKLGFYEELCRVLIHAVLHLVGYDDKTPQAQRQMRSQEDACLAMPTLQKYLSKVAKKTI